MPEEITLNMPATWGSTALAKWKLVTCTSIYIFNQFLHENIHEQYFKFLAIMCLSDVLSSPLCL